MFGILGNAYANRIQEQEAAASRDESVERAVQAYKEGRTEEAASHVRDAQASENRRTSIEANREMIAGTYEMAQEKKRDRQFLSRDASRR